MTRYLIIVLVLVAAAPPRLADAQVTRTVTAFDAGTEALLAGEYTRAVEQFDAAEGAGFASAALYYNRGLAHFRRDALGLAIRDFEQAKLLEPDNRLVNHALEIANRRIEQPISRVPASFTQRAWRLAASRPAAAFWIGATGYLLLMVLLALRLRARKPSDWRRRGIAVCSVLALGGLVIGLLGSAFPPQRDRAVVIDDRATVRAQADPAGESVASASEGVVVRIRETTDQWLRVRLPNGVDGWMAADAVVPIRY